MIRWDLLTASGAALVEHGFGKQSPIAALVLGSGLTLGSDGFSVLAEIGYDHIPALGASTVHGHAGKLQLIERAGCRLLAFLGRRHFYELDGPDITPIVAPAFLARALGANILVLTNASGGITKNAGDFVVVSDHVNFSGISPLKGTHREDWGPRFPDQSRVYSRALQEKLGNGLRAAGVEPTSGIYLQVPGPNYETPAEIEVFRRWGVDIVGMSTAIEASFANGGGVEVGCVSLVANKACGLTDAPLSHQEVLEAGKKSVSVFKAFVHSLFEVL